MLDTHIELNPDESNVPGDEYTVVFDIYICHPSNKIIDQSIQAEMNKTMLIEQELLETNFKLQTSLQLKLFEWHLNFWL